MSDNTATKWNVRHYKYYLAKFYLDIWPVFEIDKKEKPWEMLLAYLELQN